jgi:hypothetical protein
MNEFAAKKLGEVLAFCRVGQETLERARDGFEREMEGGGNVVDKVIADLERHADKIEVLAHKAGTHDITFAKADATGEKLRAMRDMYIGDEWDNPTEVLEWTGFFEGAAMVHWAVVDGAAKALKLDDLETLAKEGQDYHEDMLKTVAKLLREIGGKRAQA